MSNEKITLMLTEITWGTYLRLVAASLFIYYAFLAFKFYFTQIRTSLSGAAPDFFGPKPYEAMSDANESLTEKENAHFTSSGSFTAQESGSDYEIIEEIVERVKSGLQHAADSNMATDEVLSGFKTILSDYPTLAVSTFKPSINEFIASESELHGFPAITQEAVGQLWRTV